MRSKAVHNEKGPPFGSQRNEYVFASGRVSSFSFPNVSLSAWHIAKWTDRQHLMAESPTLPKIGRQCGQHCGQLHNALPSAFFAVFLQNQRKNTCRPSVCNVTQEVSLAHHPPSHPRAHFNNKWVSARRVRSCHLRERKQEREGEHINGKKARARISGII